MLYSIIIAGGRGERFWPKSRRSLPKQFLHLFGKKSLVELTHDRVKAFCPLERQRYVIPDDLVSPLRTAMPGLKSRNLITEPEGKNTAIAIGLAAVRIIHDDPDAILVVLPADHLIADTGRFRANVAFARTLAQQGHLVTFGVSPVRPETGYGYIEAGDTLTTAGNLKAFSARGFTEKPSLEKAREYCARGNFFWNSGMFVWTAHSILRAIDAYMPELGESLRQFSPFIRTKKETRAKERLYQSVRPVSIDHGVMERAKNIAVVQADFDWDDVGSWLALERHSEKHLDNNAIFGKYVGVDTKNSIIWTEGGMVATLGIRDLLVVRTGDTVLVCPKARAQDVKKLVELLAKDTDGKKFT